jgi:hypothetical protein
MRLQKARYAEIDRRVSELMQQDPSQPNGTLALIIGCSYDEVRGSLKRLAIERLNGRPRKIKVS